MMAGPGWMVVADGMPDWIAVAHLDAQDEYKNTACAAAGASGVQAS